MLRCRGDEVVSTVCDLVVVQPGPCTVTLDVGGPGSICASLFASDSGGIVPKGAAWTCRWPDCGILSLLPGEPPQQESGFKQRFAIHGQTNKFVPEAQRPGLASPGPVSRSPLRCLWCLWHRLWGRRAVSVRHRTM